MHPQNEQQQQPARGLAVLLDHSLNSLGATAIAFAPLTTRRLLSPACLPAVCAMFSQYCEVPFQVEPVEVVDAFGQTQGETPMACPSLPCPCMHPHARHFLQSLTATASPNSCPLLSFLLSSCFS